MSTDFDIEILAANFDTIRRMPPEVRDNALTLCQHIEDFMDLYNYLVGSEKAYIGPAVISYLDKFEANENLLRELIDMWKDTEDECVAYWTLLKYPNLMKKIKTFQFSNCLYVNQLIKVITDVDKKSEIVLALTANDEMKRKCNGKIYTHFDNFEFKGDFNTVLRLIVSNIELNRLCKVYTFTIDGENEIGRIPFHYFETSPKSNFPPFKRPAPNRLPSPPPEDAATSPI